MRLYRDRKVSFDGEQLEAVYTFPAELCERLDEAAERQLRDDGDVLSEGEPSADESSDAEESTQAPSAEQRARDERCARCADATWHLRARSAAQQRSSDSRAYRMCLCIARPSAPTVHPHCVRAASSHGAARQRGRLRAELAQ